MGQGVTGRIALLIGVVCLVLACGKDSTGPSNLSGYWQGEMAAGVVFALTLNVTGEGASGYGSFVGAGEEILFIADGVYVAPKLSMAIDLIGVAGAASLECTMASRTAACALRTPTLYSFTITKR